MALFPVNSRIVSTLLDLVVNKIFDFFKYFNGSIIQHQVHLQLNMTGSQLGKSEFSMSKADEQAVPNEEILEIKQSMACKKKAVLSVNR